MRNDHFTVPPDIKTLPPPLVTPTLEYEMDYQDSPPDKYENFPELTEDNGYKTYQRVRSAIGAILLLAFIATIIINSF